MNDHHRVPLSWLLIGLGSVLTACESSTEPEQVGSLALTPAAVELAPGGTHQLIATVLSRTGSVLSGHPVSWTSAVPAVASVTEAGLVTGESVGSTSITAESGGESAAVQVTVVPGECTGPTAGSLGVGDTRTGTLGPEDCSLFPGTRAAGWDLELAAETFVRVDLTSEVFWPQLVVTDLEMNPMAWGNPFDVGASRAVASLPAGSYTVWAVVHENEPPGSYELSIEEAHRCMAETTRGAITVGQVISGVLAPDDCLLPHTLPGAGYDLTLTEPTNLRIDLASSGFDPILIITDSELEPRFWADYSGPGLNARIERRIPPGEYVVWATSSGGMGGAFELSTQEVEIELCPVVGTVPLGEAVGGQLSGASCAEPNGQYLDPWTLTVADSTTLQIDLTSGQFDTYLILEDEDGTWLAEDDDGGVGLNSRLVYAAPPGQYRVVVTSYGPGEVGSYQLSTQSLSGTAGVGAMIGAPGPGWSGIRYYKP